MKILTKLFAPTTPTTPTPKEVEVPDTLVDSETIKSYEKLAERAGFVGSKVVLEMTRISNLNTVFKRFLAENGITVYDATAVAKHMARITPLGHTWGWVPLIHEQGPPASTGGGYVTDGIWGPYSKPIPQAVLMTMAKIREQYSPDVQFQITDITIPNGDPFLRVSPDGTNWYIIERWDEPGFRQ